MLWKYQDIGRYVSSHFEHVSLQMPCGPHRSGSGLNRMSKRCEFWVSHWTNSRGQVLRFHTKLLIASSLTPKMGMETHSHLAQLLKHVDTLQHLLCACAWDDGVWALGHIITILLPCSHLSRSSRWYSKRCSLLDQHTSMCAASSGPRCREGPRQRWGMP